MDQFIRTKAETVELSDGDIMRMCRGNVVIHEYGDLAKLTDYKEIFGGKGAAVILYETRENFGHWVLLLDLGSNKVEFFDPLGIRMDQELSVIPDYYREKLNEVTPHLSHILRGVHVVQNTTQLQAVDHDVNTCGRHVVTRFRFYERGFGLKTYIRLYENQKELPDVTVSKLTLML